MNTENPQITADTILTLIVAELLLSPEYGRSWVQEFVVDHDLELTEAQIDTLDEAVIRTLDQLAIPFVKSLPEPQRATYMAVLTKREAQIHPVGEGHERPLEL